ncbi:MAG: hypothetical protein QW563_06570, partial [Candidatus Methanomethylicia archaeon]
FQFGKPLDTRIIETLLENEKYLLSIDGVLGAGIERDENNYIKGVAIYIDKYVANTTRIPTEIGGFKIYVKDKFRSQDIKNMIIRNRSYLNINYELWFNTTLIGVIIENPYKYVDREVVLIGYYRGWDLLGEVNYSPPVTRSDIVIADATGAIYIDAHTVSNIKNLPSPYGLGDIKTLIYLKGFVRISKDGKPYIDVIEGETISNILPPGVVLHVFKQGGIAGFNLELMIMSNGLIYFIDHKANSKVRFNITPMKVKQILESSVSLLSQDEIGEIHPDCFIYTVTGWINGEVKTTRIFVGKIPENIRSTLNLIDELFRKGRSQ